MGAQQAYHWAALFGEAVERIVVNCGSARTAPHNFVFLEGVRSAVQAARTPEEGLRAMGRIYAGWALSQAECERIFIGKAVRDERARIEAETGQPLTEDWMRAFYARRDQRLRAELQAMDGALQAVIGSAACLVLYAVAKDQFGVLIARVAVVFAVISFPLLFAAAAIGHQAIDVFLTLVLVWLLWRVLQRISAIVRDICSTLGWRCGALWQPDANGESLARRRSRILRPPSQGPRDRGTREAARSAPD